MSATPIPRTLAMILYGNMHVSAIKELPANRLPIKTCVIKESMRATAYKFVSDEIAKGHQVYIICPLVEASETTEAQNVTDYSKKLKEHFSNTHKEFEFHPVFEGQPLESFVKMDLMIEGKRGNVIVECKSIKEITDKERYQTFGYLRATGFPIALLVNFGTWPKAQIERYYYHDNKIKAF